jgi:hypothetical protein
MQPIIISFKNPTRSPQYVICIDNMKQDSYCISIGTICSRAFLVQRKKLASVMLHELVLQAFTAMASFSCEKAPMTMSLHTTPCTFYLINEFDSKINLNSFDSIATIWFYIFLGYNLNLEE